MVITFQNVEFKYIEKKILDRVSFSFNDFDKIGVVGVNGTGKTTLLKLILGMEQPLSGEIIKSGGMIINYLPQEPVFPKNVSLLEIVMAASTKEHPIEEYEAKAMLSKLGFTDYDSFANTLSGGQLKRLALCKVLVGYCDMLLLDEPTNHLDTGLILWLEKFLMKWKKGLVMVTHDRYFLQRVCNKMLELDFGKVYLYEANYELFLELKAERLEAQSHQQKKLKAILKSEREWMSRGVEARRTKSKSRIERFNALSQVEFNEAKTMEFTSVSSRLGRKLITMKHGYKAFGDKVLFEDFSFDLSRNDIIGIVGENGAGKTTLFKILMQEESLDCGELSLGQTLNIGYFSQHLELNEPEIRVIDYIKSEQSLIETLDGTISAAELLERFMFTGNLPYSKVKMLSGGEKRRLQLIRVLMKNPNVLIFDEPTNDLDLYTLEILEDYLMSFKGPVLVVSHDRYFLDKICNKLFVFKEKRIEESNLSYSEYLEKNMAVSEAASRERSGVRIKNKMPASLRNELARLEESLPKLEEEIQVLREELATHSTDYHKLLELNEEIQKKDDELNAGMERYFELEELRSSYK